MFIVMFKINCAPHFLTVHINDFIITFFIFTREIHLMHEHMSPLISKNILKFFQIFRIYKQSQNILNEDEIDMKLMLNKFLFWDNKVILER